MLDNITLERTEINELLAKVGYGHLGFIHDGKPSIISVHYYLQDGELYLFMAAGNKTHDFDANPAVCLQVEETIDPHHWRSATVNGTIECLSVESNIDRAIEFINHRQPGIASAIDRAWMESWGADREIAIYRIEADEMSGRTNN